MAKHGKPRIAKADNSVLAIQVERLHRIERRLLNQESGLKSSTKWHRYDISYQSPFKRKAS